MLRRQARLRREYFYKKSKENRQHKINSKKDKLKENLEKNTFIHGDVQTDAIQLLETFKYDVNGVYNII